MREELVPYWEGHDSDIPELRRATIAITDALIEFRRLEEALMEIETGGLLEQIASDELAAQQQIIQGLYKRWYKAGEQL